MLSILIRDKSAMRLPSWRRRAFTNSWRCLAMWYSAFSLRSPRAAAFLISLGSSWTSSCSSAFISSCSFLLICSVIAFGDYKPMALVAGIRCRPPSPISLKFCHSDDERSEEEESAVGRKRQTDSSRQKTGARNDKIGENLEACQHFGI